MEMLNTSTHKLNWVAPYGMGRSRKLDSVSINGGDAIKLTTNDMVNINIAGKHIHNL